MICKCNESVVQQCNTVSLEHNLCRTEQIVCHKKSAESSSEQIVCNTTVSNTEQGECGTVHSAHSARAGQSKGSVAQCTVPELCRARGVWPPETQCPSVQPLSPLARLQYSQCPNLCSSTMHSVHLCKQHCLLSRSCRAA